jgi:hypothetical protein
MVVITGGVVGGLMVIAFCDASRVMFDQVTHHSGVSCVV